MYSKIIDKYLIYKILLLILVIIFSMGHHKNNRSNIQETENKNMNNIPVNELLEDIRDTNKKKEIKKKNYTIPELTITEIDLVLQQLRNCFNPRAGAQIDGDEQVQIFTKVDRNANIIKETVKIISTNISKSNPYYEAITESAVATLYNPMCSKLKLPLEKYESWKDLKITIDYSWVN